MSPQPSRPDPSVPEPGWIRWPFTSRPVCGVSTETGSDDDDVAYFIDKARALVGDEATNEALRTWATLKGQAPQRKRHPRPLRAQGRDSRP